MRIRAAMTRGPATTITAAPLLLLQIVALSMIHFTWSIQQTSAAVGPSLTRPRTAVVSDLRIVVLKASVN